MIVQSEGREHGVNTVAHKIFHKLNWLLMTWLLVRLKRYSISHQSKALAEDVTNFDNLTLRDIYARSLLSSSRFSSMFGQQNNELVRTLRLKEKDVVAEVLRDAINSQFRFFKNENPSLLSEIKQNGFVRISNLMQSDSAFKICEYFKTKEGVAFHVWENDKQKVRFSDLKDQPQCAFSASDLLENEALRNLFLNEEVLDLVEGYLGAPARIFHVNAMCSFPSGKDGLGQQFHRDHCQPHFCVLFVYLSDVDINSGAHQYYKFTHDRGVFEKNYPDLDSEKFFDLPQDSYGFDEVFESSLDDSRETITGPAGTCFLTDPRGLHRGLPPKVGKRWLAWARYSLIPDASMIPKVKLTSDATKHLNGRQLYCLSSLIEE